MLAKRFKLVRLCRCSTPTVNIIGFSGPCTSRCGKFFHSFNNIDTILDAIYFSMRAGFPKFRLAPRCLAPCFYRLMRDFHCDKATLRSSANCS